MALNEEQIKRLLEKAERPEYKRKIKGYTASAVDGKVGFEKNVKGDKVGWAKPGPITTNVDWDLTPLRKRSERERVESLTKRLVEASKDPAQLEFLLRKAQGEFWQRGKTYSIEDIKRVAAELIEKAAKEQAERERRKF